MFRRRRDQPRRAAGARGDDGRAPASRADAAWDSVPAHRASAPGCAPSSEPACPRPSPPGTRSRRPSSARTSAPRPPWSWSMPPGARFRAAGGRTGEDARRALATEIRDRLVAVGVRAVRARRGPVGDPLRRRQRHRQDDLDRQARRPAHRRGSHAWPSRRRTRSARRPSSSCASGESSSGCRSSRSAPARIRARSRSTPWSPPRRGGSMRCWSTPPAACRTSSS